MTWLRDFEKKAFLFMLVGFMWALAWMLMTFVVQLWINLLADNIIVMFMGMSALVGFVCLMGYGIIVLTIGLFKPLFALPKNKDGRKF